MSDPSSSLESLLDIVKSSTSAQIAVFSSLISSIEEVTQFLQAKGIQATCIHSELKLEQRAENLLNFLNGSKRVLVGSDLIERGLELNVQHVILFNVSEKLDSLLRRVGRTGRKDKPGRVTLFLRKTQEHLIPLIKKNQAQPKKTR
mgnify:FL=1